MRPPGVPSAAMGRVNLPYLCSEINRHGKRVWYVRKGQGPRIRVHGSPDDPGFAAAYEAACRALLDRLQQGAPPPKPRTIEGSYSRALLAYARSESLNRLQMRGRITHRRYLERLGAVIGDAPLASIDRAALEEWLRPDSPGARYANIKMLRRFFGWCVDMDLIAADPSERLKGQKSVTPGGHAPWTREQVAERRAVWPVGTMQRLALELILNTCARRSDLVNIGRQNIRTVDGTPRIEFTASKTARSSGVRVSVRILPGLAACLASAPASGALALIQTRHGTSRASGNSFANVWKDWQAQAGLEPINLHGARKLAAELAAEAGASVAEIMALLGHTSPVQAMHYARKFQRAALADKALDRIHNPAPDIHPSRTGTDDVEI